MKEDEMLANFRIERRLWKKFGEKARKHGSNRSRILRTMIRYFVEERESSEWLFVDENGRRYNCKMFVVKRRNDDACEFK